MHPLTLEQVRAMLRAAEDDWVRPLLLTAVLTGLRKGELLGLRWEDVDLAGRLLHVRRAVGRVRTPNGYRLTEDQPKSKQSRRVDMPPEVVAALRALPSRFAAGLVLTRPDGGRVDPANLVRRDFARILKRAGIPRIRFHDLRHTYVALLIAQGAHPKYIQQQLGHASITTTLDTYGHLMPQAFQGVSERLGRAVCVEESGADGHNLVTTA